MSATKSVISKQFEKAFFKYLKDTAEDGKVSISLLQAAGFGYEYAMQANKIKLPFKSEAFNIAWCEWVKHRNQKNKKLTPISITKQLKMLSGYSEFVAIRMIDEAITQGWTGIFPLKDIEVVQLNDFEYMFKKEFINYYLSQTNIEYEWMNKDNQGIKDLAQIFKKRTQDKNILQSALDIEKLSVSGFITFLGLLKEFHRKRYLTPSLLCKNFNTIIAEISHANSNSKANAQSAHDYV